MRQSIHRQLSLTAPGIDHEHAMQMEQMGVILDQHPQLEQLVDPDLVTARTRRDTGRSGMTADQVLRALIVKQINQYSYDDLAFVLADSATYRAFCRFGAFDATPRRSALHDNLRRIKAETIEKMNHILLGIAAATGVEKAHKVRIDTTASRTHIHEPTDSSLLWDAIRVLVTQMQHACEHVDFVWSDHTKRAKRRTVAIISARKGRRIKLYADLIGVAIKTVGYAQRTLDALQNAGLLQLPCAKKLAYYLPLARQVIDQARRRVIDGQKVAASDKLLSIFEPATDIIVRGQRDPIYGHKLSLTVGASSLVIDCVIEKGNPTDSSLAVNMVQRSKSIYGTAPRQAVFDGGFSSIDNVADIKAEGVTDVAFTKHLGIEISDMVRSDWVFKRLRRFRAGVEGCISYLKRCFGIARCTWRAGRQRFAAYVWSSILSANLLTLARHQLSG